MMTVTICRPAAWRLIPAAASNEAGWQFHWLFLYVEWLSLD